MSKETWLPTCRSPAEVARCHVLYSFSCTHTSPTTAPSQSHKKRQHRKGDASEPAEASRSEVSIIGMGSEIRWSIRVNILYIVHTKELEMG